MGKYDNVTMKEYMKKKREMLDDLGRLKGQCIGASCLKCPFYDLNCNEVELENPDKALEIVMEYEPKID